jgi:hypothetical protein
MNDKAERARQAVKLIIQDLSDRRGLKAEWFQIDVSTKKEIEKTWAKIIEEQMP